MRALHRIFRVSVAAALVALVPGRGHATTRAGDEAGDARARGAELMALVDAGAEVDVTRLAHRLAALGRPVAPFLLEELARRLPAVDAPGHPRAPDVQIVIAALGGLSANAWRADLETLARRGSAERRAAAALLGAHGRASDLELLLAIAAPALDPDGFDEPGQSVYTGALTRLARREPATWEVAKRVTLSAELPVQLLAVRAAGRGGGADGLGFLAWSLDAFPARRVETLVELQRAVQRGRPPFDERVVAAVRRVLDGTDFATVPTAALLAGRLEDGASVGRLIELLGSERDGVRANAMWALQAVSGLKMRDAQRWSTWYATELAWWHEAADAEIETVAMGEASPAKCAILELARHRLHRDRLALAIADGLQHDDPSVARLAAVVLPELRSRAAVPALVEALDRIEPGVRANVLAALRALTARDLGEEPRAWREALPRL